MTSSITNDTIIQHLTQLSSIADEHRTVSSTLFANTVSAASQRFTNQFVTYKRRSQLEKAELRSQLNALEAKRCDLESSLGLVKSEREATLNASFSPRRNAFGASPGTPSAGGAGGGSLASSQTLDFSPLPPPVSGSRSSVVAVHVPIGAAQHPIGLSEELRLNQSPHAVAAAAAAVLESVALRHQEEEREKRRVAAEAAAALGAARAAEMNLLQQMHEQEDARAQREMTDRVRQLKEVRVRKIAEVREQKEKDIATAIELVKEAEKELLRRDMNALEEEAVRRVGEARSREREQRQSRSQERRAEIDRSLLLQHHQQQEHSNNDSDITAAAQFRLIEQHRDATLQRLREHEARWQAELSAERRRLEAAAAVVEKCMGEVTELMSMAAAAELDTSQRAREAGETARQLSEERDRERALNALRLQELQALTDAVRRENIKGALLELPAVAVPLTPDSEDDNNNERAASSAPSSSSADEIQLDLPASFGPQRDREKGENLPSPVKLVAASESAVKSIMMIAAPSRTTTTVKSVDVSIQNSGEVAGAAATTTTSEKSPEQRMIAAADRFESAVARVEDLLSTRKSSSPSAFAAPEIALPNLGRSSTAAPSPVKAAADAVDERNNNSSGVKHEVSTPRPPSSVSISRHNPLSSTATATLLSSSPTTRQLILQQPEKADFYQRVNLNDSRLSVADSHAADERQEERREVTDEDPLMDRSSAVSGADDFDQTAPASEAGDAVSDVSAVEIAEAMAHAEEAQGELQQQQQQQHPQAEEKTNEQQVAVVAVAKNSAAVEICIGNELMSRAAIDGQEVDGRVALFEQKRLELKKVRVYVAAPRATLSAALSSSSLSPVSVGSAATAPPRDSPPQEQHQTQTRSVSAAPSSRSSSSTPAPAAAAAAAAAFAPPVVSASSSAEPTTSSQQTLAQQDVAQRQNKKILVTALAVVGLIVLALAMGQESSAPPSSSSPAISFAAGVPTEHDVVADISVFEQQAEAPLDHDVVVPSELQQQQQQLQQQHPLLEPSPPNMEEPAAADGAAPENADGAPAAAEKHTSVLSPTDHEQAAATPEAVKRNDAPTLTAAPATEQEPLVEAIITSSSSSSISDKKKEEQSPFESDPVAVFAFAAESHSTSSSLITALFHSASNVTLAAAGFCLFLLVLFVRLLVNSRSALSGIAPLDEKNAQEQLRRMQEHRRRRLGAQQDDGDDGPQLDCSSAFASERTQRLREDEEKKKREERFQQVLQEVRQEQQAREEKKRAVLRRRCEEIELAEHRGRAELRRGQEEDRLGMLRKEGVARATASRPAVFQPPRAASVSATAEAPEPSRSEKEETSKPSALLLTSAASASETASTEAAAAVTDKEHEAVELVPFQVRLEDLECAENTGRQAVLLQEDAALGTARRRLLSAFRMAEEKRRAELDYELQYAQQQNSEEEFRGLVSGMQVTRLRPWRERRHDAPHLLDYSSSNLQRHELDELAEMRQLLQSEDGGAADREALVAAFTERCGVAEKSLPGLWLLESVPRWRLESRTLAFAGARIVKIDISSCCIRNSRNNHHSGDGAVVGLDLSAFAALPSLKWIDVSNNQLWGRVAGMDRMPPSLTHLYVSENVGLCGPLDLTALPPNFAVLQAHTCSFSGQLHLANLPPSVVDINVANQRHVAPSSTPTTSTLLSSSKVAAAMPATSFSGGGFEGVVDLTQLPAQIVSVNLSGNRLSSVVLPDAHRKPALSRLSLAQNMLSGAMLESVLALTTYQAQLRLDVRGNAALDESLRSKFESDMLSGVSSCPSSLLYTKRNNSASSLMAEFAQTQTNNSRSTSSPTPNSGSRTGSTLAMAR